MALLSLLRQMIAGGEVNDPALRLSADVEVAA